MRRVLISTKPFIFVLFPVGVTVRSAESLSSAIPLGTSTERANSKRANHGRSRLFQDAVLSVSFWLRSFSVCGWRTRSLSSVSGPPTRWSCVRGWLMRLLWAYEHDFAAISPFLYERIGTLCRHPCWSLWLEQRIAGWRSGRSEGYCKSLSAGHAPTDLLLLTQRTSRPVPGWFRWSVPRGQHGASISFGAPSVDRMSIAASGDGFTSSEDEGAVGLPPSGVVATAAPDPELTAMLARAAVSIGLEVNRPPSPEPSRLDDWFPQCLSSRRCMRSWRVRGWPLSRPEAARPPPSSLPSMAEWPGGTRAFPRWRERSRCTCAHETPPLGGTVRVSRPRPVSWQPLSRPKLTVLRARQPPPCTPWLSCRFTKPRRSNRCTRVVPTRGWCRSCARRLTSLYERRKSRRGPSGRRCPPWWSRSAISGSTWQRWRTSTRHAFSMPPSPREGCSATPSRASPSSSRRYSSRPRRSSTSCPGVMHHPPLPPGPGLSLPVDVGALLRPPEPLRPRPNRHIGRCVEPLAGERRPPRPSQAPSRPGSRRSGPDAGNPEMLEFALSQETARTAPLLPPVEGREENLLFRFVSVPPLVQGPSFPPSQRKSNFLFLRVLRSMGRQCATPCLLTLAHDPFCQ